MHTLPSVHRGPAIPVAAVFVLLLALFAPLIAPQAVQAQPQAITVTSLSDSPQASQVTLRQAITSVAAGGTITFAANLLPGTINLTGGELVIDKDLTIQGPGPALLTINGNDALGSGFRAFHIEENATVTISGVTIAGGRTTQGAAIQNDGDLTINSSTIMNNIAIDRGGAIHNTGDLTINGGAISGNQAFLGGAIYSDSGTVTLSGVSLLNNEAHLGGGYFGDEATANATGGTISGNTAVNGAGAFIEGGSMTLTGVVLAENDANTTGGGLVNLDGDVSFTGGTLRDNTALSEGSAIYNQNGTTSITGTAIYNNETQTGTVHVMGGELTVTGATIRDNTAFHGGGLYLEGGALTVDRSTLSGNEASYGGAIMLTSGELTVTTSTISGNTAENAGGAIHSEMANFSLVSTTIFGNTANNGSAIWNGAGTGTVEASILASDPSTENVCNFPLTSNGFNITTDESCFGQETGTDTVRTLDQIRLGPLQNNGGGFNTMTHMPLAGSPALNSIPSFNCPDASPVDQRGVPRPQEGGCDIGAVEYIDLSEVADPALSLPASFSVTTDDEDGATVTFTTSATDWIGNPVSVSCTPASGSLFEVGTTKVNCTATDSWGKSSSGTFNVIVVLDDDPGNGDGDGDGDGDGNGEEEPELPAVPATPAFDRVWERTDQPVANGQADRTWIWGPAPIDGPRWEAYAQSPDGWRVVLYHEKSRMEINNPDGDPNSEWYVTNGLLVNEMISGNMQVGDAEFEERAPADIPVAGDMNDPDSPTYATFTDLAFPNSTVSGRLGETVVERIDKDGTVTTDESLVERGVTIAHVDEVTGHNIAAPFWEFMNATGTVQVDGELVEDKLFTNPFYGTGRPVTEAYWATVNVGGTPHDVLMQCFERRCLTYTPDNPEGWQVEAGNVGTHYHVWRYGYEQ